MNEIIISYARPLALIAVLGCAIYMEMNQLKVSEFFIGIATTVVVWFFKDRDEKSRQNGSSNS